MGRLLQDGPGKKLKPVAEHDFETVDSETIYVGKIFALRADEVRMPRGNIARREVVEHYGAVAVLAMDDDNNIVMVYQYRHPVGRRLWELPAGLLDLGGEPPHITAARELKEEAGLSAQNWRVLVDLVSAPGFSDESVRVYLATGLADVGTARCPRRGSRSGGEVVPPRRGRADGAQRRDREFALRWPAFWPHRRCGATSIRCDRSTRRGSTGRKPSRAERRMHDDVVCSAQAAPRRSAGPR